MIPRGLELSSECGIFDMRCDMRYGLVTYQFEGSTSYGVDSRRWGKYPPIGTIRVPRPEAEETTLGVNK